MRKQQLVKVTLKNGSKIEVLPIEVPGLRKAGKLLEKDQDAGEAATKNENPETVSKRHTNNHSSQDEAIITKREVLTSKQRKNRIKRARKLRKQGYPIREIGKRLNVSHTAVIKWTR